MAKTRINIADVLNSVGQLYKVKLNIANIECELEATRIKTDSAILEINEIDQRMKKAREQILEVEKEVQKIYTSIQEGALQYGKVERKIGNLCRELQSMSQTL